jgi:ketosteroid isomerase-like protein
MKPLFPWISLALTLCFASACRSAPSGPEAELLAADRAFCAATQERRLEAWIAAFDEHGSQVSHDFRPITGAEAIRAHMGSFFADPANVLWWEPDTARVSEAGNLGSTTGRFRVERRGEAGKVEVVAQGRYFDIWRRLPAEQGGTWKIFLDLGEPDVAAEPER